MNMQHKDRISTIFVGPGELSVKNDSLIFSDCSGGSFLIPVNQFSVVCLEPGTSISHAAVKLCSDHSCMLNWVGDSGIRLYSSGSFSSARSERLWWQITQATNKNKSLSIAKRMYSYRFSLNAIGSYSVEQMSGMEGSHVKKIYEQLASEYGISWNGRKFIYGEFDKSDRVNKCISTANSCIYGLCHTAILSAGYSPAIGFIHGKTAHSFVYDIADLFKFSTVTRIAFRVASNMNDHDPVRTVRYQCRDFFHQSNFMDKIIPVIDEVLGYDIDYKSREPVLTPQDFQSYADRINTQDPEQF